MALFNKKKRIKSAVSNPNADVNSKKFDYKTEVLTVLNKKLNGTLYDGCIIMPRGYTVDIRIVRHEENAEIKLLQAIFIVQHDDFDEPLIDPIDAHGKTYSEVAETAADIFYGSVWYPINMSILKQNPIHIPVTYLNQSYDFDLYAKSILRIGPKKEYANNMLLSMIKHEIPKYLGSKKYYWIRIYLVRFKDKIIIEVRINGSVCSELSKYFQEYINSWNAENTFILEKQYGIFVQREDDKCPFNKETVIKTAKAAIKRMVKCSNHEEYMKMAEELDEIAGDKSIAAEVRIFIPEIFGKLILGHTEGDSLFLLDGKNKVEFKKTQLRSYFYLQQVIIEYLNTRPPKDDVKRIVFNSAVFRELKKAKEKGHKPNELYIPGTAYKIPNDNYKVW